MIVRPNVFILSTALMTSIEIFINGQSSKIKRKGLRSVYSLKDNCLQCFQAAGSKGGS